MNKYFWLLLPLYFFALQTAAVAQSKRGNIGVFGNYNGVAIDFNTSPPSTFPVPENYFNTDEASATVCDIEGNLLFYTNGVAVWNRHHICMPHNTGLRGSDTNTTTTQIVIVPLPKDPFQYYIITPGWQGKAMTYSLVDMRLDNGMGDIVFENKLLYDSSTEKVAVVKHSSNESLWLITHEYKTNNFRSYLIDEDGMNTDYVESSVGFVHEENIQFFNPFYIVYGTNTIGFIQASHDGNFLACTVDGEMGTAELFKFDKSTGKVSSPIVLLNDKVEGSYGVEFSADNTKLYVSCSSSKNLYQFDLSSGDPTTILNSKSLISSSVYGALQLGPDNKIYCVPIYNSTFLDCINSPNELDASCDFEKNAVNLGLIKVWCGLPEFSYNPVDPEIIYQGFCPGFPTTFNLINIKEFESIEWTFGDSDSGTKNFSSNISPSHIYPAPGYYKIKAKITFADNSVFNYSQRISILTPPTVSLAKDSALCENYILYLYPRIALPNLDYTWNDGSKNPFIDATKGGQYSVQISDGMCTASDTMNVSIIPNPGLFLKDTTLCLGQAITVTLPSAYQYEWGDGLTSAMRTLNIPGKYNVQGTNQCGINLAELNLTFLPKLNPNLPFDTLLCSGQMLKVDTTNTQAECLWNDSSTEPSSVIIESGEHWVQMSNRCEIVKEIINVGIIPFPELPLKDTTLCLGQTISIALPLAFQYEWNDGSSNSDRTFNSPARYTVEGRNQCGIRQAELNLSFMPKLSMNLPADTLLCFNELLKVDVTSTSQVEYRWQDGSTEPLYTISKSGKYWVQVYNRCESINDSIKVEYPSDRPYFIPNVITPNEDGLNDYFVIEDIRQNTSVRIIDRLGQSMYSSDNYKNEWNAQELPSGTYYYILRDKCANDEKKGWLSVLK